MVGKEREKGRREKRERGMKKWKRGRESRGKKQGLE